MDSIALASYLDSTNLKPEARGQEIEALCQEAIEYNMAAVCVHPYRLPWAYRCICGSPVQIGTVIGFPLGAGGQASKAYEAAMALDQGANELDMVINLGAVKDHDYTIVRSEIDTVVALKQHNDFILKLIVETALLTQMELANITELINQTGADYIKTSTGFASRGVSLEDLSIINQHKRPLLKIKASGGIKDLDFALSLIKAGADRLGTSSAAQIIQSYNLRQQKLHG